jgi:cyclophilin family peptidyl-prolyl cis-trans isomerase/protein-disulfide isomerase
MHKIFSFLPSIILKDCFLSPLRLLFGHGFHGHHGEDPFINALFREIQCNPCCPCQKRVVKKHFLRAGLLLSLLISSCSPPASSPNATGSPFPDIINPTQTSCTTLIAEPTPGPDAASLFPPESEEDHTRGAENPAVTIIAYIDYQDIRSKFFVDVTNRLLAESPNDVRVLYRIVPLIGVLDKASLSAQAVEAAQNQNKFWEMHDLLYTQHQNWSQLSDPDFEQWLIAQASSLPQMNVEQFKSDLESEEVLAKVQKLVKEGQRIGIPGVPLILINGQIYNGPRDYTSFNDILQLILLGKRQFASCPPLTVQTNKQYIATLHTEKGDIVIQLFADKAPITVNSFIFLARSGWYDDITFHRVIPDLFAQTGDPSGTGKGNPGYYIITEIVPSLTFNKPGVVAMVNSGPDTSGSQFFITYVPTAQFDGKFTIFGQVLRGMDVLESLTPRDAQPGTETMLGDRLLNVVIEEK